MSESKRKSSRIAAAPVVNFKDASDSDSGEDMFDEDAQQPSTTQARHRQKRKALQTPDAGTSAAAQGKRQKKLTPDKTDTGALTLFDVVSKHATAITSATKDWINKYKNNKAEGVAELMTLIIQAAGMDEAVTAEEAEGGDMDEVMQQLAEQAKKEGAADPMHAKAFKNFRTNYLTFWERLMQQAHLAMMAADDYLADRLISLLIAMSCSVVRPFRLVATLTAAQLVSSWVRVLVASQEARDTADKGLKAEEKKKQSKDVQGRKKTLKAALERHNKEAADLTATITRAFEAVFTNRFRDVSPEIRAAVITAIGRWICSCRAVFMTDSYLKYIAWAMSDKDSEVRAAACNALLALYADEGNTQPLQQFTQRFSPRFQEIIHDINEDVAVLGVQLVTRLVQLGEMPASAVKDVYMLLADDSALVRQSVGELVVRLLTDYGTARIQEAQQLHKSKGKKPSTDTVQLEGLLHIMAELEVHKGDGAPSPSAPSTSAAARKLTLRASHPLPEAVTSGLVEALYDRVDVLRNWKALAGALQEEGPVADKRSAGDLANLAGLLSASATRAATAPKTGKLGPRKAGSSAAAEGARQQMTQALMSALPTALTRHAAEPLVVAPLAACVPSMQLELYALGQRSEDLEAVLKLLSEVFFRHGQATTMQRCAAAITCAVEKAPESLRSQALVVWKGCQQGTVTRLAAAVKAVAALPEEELAVELEVFASEHSADSEQLTALHTALLRMQAVLAAARGQDLVVPTMFDLLEQILSGMPGGLCLGPVLAVLAANCWFTLLCWALNEAAGGGASAGNAVVTELAARKGRFLHHVGALFDALEEADSAKDRLFKMTTDTLFLFGRGRWRGTALDAVVSEPEQELLEHMWGQCCAILQRYPEPDEEEEAARDEEKEAEGERMKRNAVSSVVRIVVHGCVGQQRLQWLATNVVAVMVGHGDAVTELAKEMLSTIRRSQPQMLPEMFLGALKQLYEQYKVAAVATGGQQAGAEDEEAEEEEGGRPGVDAAVQLVAELGKQISHQYIGATNANTKAAVLEIVNGGVAYSLQDPPSHLRFLPWALGGLTSRMAPEDAGAVAADLEDRASGLLEPEEGQEVEDSEAVDALELYLQGLKDRAARGGLMKSAMKGARGQAATPARRISFAGGQAAAGGASAGPSRGRGRRNAQEEEEEEVEEAAEDAGEGPEEKGGQEEEEAEEEQGDDGAAEAEEQEQAQQPESSSRGGRRAGMRGVDTDAGPLGTLPSSGTASLQASPEVVADEQEPDLAASEEEEVEEQEEGEEEQEQEEDAEMVDEDEEGDEHGGGADEDEQGEEGADEEEDGEGEEMEIVPTEEELPGKGSRAAGRLNLQHVVDESEEEEAAQDAEEMEVEDDEAPARRRRRRRY